jgi:hypothetical protein
MIMKTSDRPVSRTRLGRASQLTRGAGGQMFEAGGLWTKSGIDRGR